MAAQKNRYKYFLTNLAAFLCGNLGTKMIGFLMVPLYTNALRPAEYGEIDLILSLAGVVSPFLAVGIHEGIMRFCLDKDADQKLVFSIGLRVFLISAVVFAGILPLLSFLPGVKENRSFLYAYCLLQEMLTIILCYIRGRDDIKLYSFLGFLSAFFVAASNIVFIVWLDWGLQGYKISMLAAPTITALIGIAAGRIAKDFSVKRWNKPLASEMLRYSTALIPNALLWGVMNASDRFFVSQMCGTAENGLYAVAYKLPTLLNTVAAIVMQSWQMSAIHEHEHEESHSFYRFMYRWLIFIMALAAMGLLLLNRFALKIYVADEYYTAWRYAPPLIVAFFAGSLGTFWGAFYIAEKDTPRYLHSAIAGAVVNLIMNFTLISRLGTVGAAIATAISYTVVLAVRAVGIRKKVNLPVFNKQLVSGTGCIAFSLIGAYLPGMLSWLSGLTSIVVFLLINRDMVRTGMEQGKKLLKAVRKTR